VWFLFGYSFLMSWRKTPVSRGHFSWHCNFPTKSKLCSMPPILLILLRSWRTVRRKAIRFGLAARETASWSAPQKARLRQRNTRRDPRVALSIVDFRDPYKEAQLRGRVVERRPDGDFTYGDPNSIKYVGKPFPFRSPEGRVALVIEIEKQRYTKLPFEHTPPK